jgi:hypothetical protein
MQEMHGYQAVVWKDFRAENGKKSGSYFTETGILGE